MHGKSRSKIQSPGLFAGTDQIISSFLGLSPGESLKHKRINIRLSEPKASLPEDFSVLMTALYRQILINRSDREPSKENWRKERQIEISEKNRSPEVLLERGIANLAERGALDEWYNQIPVASGFVNAHADKRAAVDLMHYREDHATLVELKWASDQPCFAAFEILRYGLAFLYAHINQRDLGYQEKPLLSTNKVSLRVLAPHTYYQGYDLTSLRSALDSGIRAIADEKTNGALSMDFGFMVFPVDFQMPFSLGTDVLRLRTEETDAGRAVAAAMNSLEPFWGEALG